MKNNPQKAQKYINSGFELEVNIDGLKRRMKEDKILDDN